MLTTPMLDYSRNSVPYKSISWLCFALGYWFKRVVLSLMSFCHKAFIHPSSVFGTVFFFYFFFLTHMKIFEPCVVVVYTFNPSTWEAGSGRSWWVSGQPDLYILSSRPKLHGKAICKKKNNFFIVVVHIFPVPAIFGAHLKHWSTRRSVRGRYCLGRLGRKGQTCISALQHCCSPLPLLLCVYFLLC